jgi:release factor glutamine methyltransferase
MKQVPYTSSEDSALLREALSGYSGRRALEIGAGNAGGLVSLARCFDYVIGSDLVRPDMRDWPRERSDFVLADRATCFVDNSFDLVAFNPPYLYSETVSDRAVDAGRESEIPLGFLEEALRVIRGAGKVVMVLGDESSVEAFRRECSRKGFSLRLVTTKRYFFESLAVYESNRRATREE